MKRQGRNPYSLTCQKNPCGPLRVMRGLDPRIPILVHSAHLNEMAGTKPGHDESG
jgi:hypothetical protein